jgi:hypothetical protein
MGRAAMSIECAFLGTPARDAESKVSKSGKLYLRFSHRSAAPINDFHDDPTGF